MKSNGTYLAVLCACVLALFCAVGQAETTHGKFKLPVEARWGKVLLEPGQYSFTLTEDASGRIVTIRSEETGLSAMVLSSSAAEWRPSNENKLLLEKSEVGVYVKALCLGEPGMMLMYATPKPAKLARLMPAPSTMASASGAH